METNGSLTSIRADFPFPRRRSFIGLPYFAVAIEAPDAALSPGRDGVDPAVLYVGLCRELKFSNLVESPPGWRSWSVAVHGDDGNIFEENDGQTYRTGRLFRLGTTIGCGVDYEKGEYLFTLDGEIIGKGHPRERNQVLKLTIPSAAQSPSGFIYRKLYL